ncbi:STRN3, partial [Symbiodinium natans]
MQVDTAPEHAADTMLRHLFGEDLSPEELLELEDGLFLFECMAEYTLAVGNTVTAIRKEEWAFKVRETERLVGLGRISQALHRLTSLGLASDTPAVRAALLAKFPAIPPGREVVGRHPAAPPGHIEMDVFLRALRSFAVGVGPGPDGLRAEFLKSMIGDSEDDPVLLYMRDFAQLLGDGLAPTYLRPWLAGGQLIGVGKHDSLGRPIALIADARPIVMGLTWRKLVFKCTLQMDKATLRERLLPDQMAVGVVCGAEAMLHATREWLASNRHQPDCVLLQTDISNAFNTLLPAQFLQDAATYAPASARFAEYYYGTPSRLVYQRESVECARGQQGCPLMAPLFCLSRCRLIEEARRNNPRPSPGFSPAFADDSFSGGSVDEVWEQFRQELQLADAYGLHVDPRKCTLYLLAGERFRGDVSRFQSLGVRKVTGADVLMLKTPISENADFLQSFQEEKQG